ncbi:MAG: hypothetical protein FWF86_02615 [Clostridia bacterium]|nr:hypothetical protein [Clostridia bacterium]
MHIKKGMKLSLLLAVACVLSQPAASLGEVQMQTSELSGLITEVMEYGIMVSDSEKGSVFLNVDAETVLEGVLGGIPLEVGMYVFAKYSGALASSKPPQTHADHLGCYALKGVVTETANGKLLLAGDALFSEALVHVESGMPQPIAGAPITVYYNGTMTMSLPPQVDATHWVFMETSETGETLSIPANIPPSESPAADIRPTPSAMPENAGTEEAPPLVPEAPHGE